MPVKTIMLIPLAEMTLSEKLVDATTVTLVGMGTVVVSLSVIGELFTLVHHLFASLEAIATAQESQLADEKSAAIVDAQLVPVIVAAATAALGRQVVVRRITFINRDTVSGWAEAGRTLQHSSHNIRRNTT